MLVSDRKGDFLLEFRTFKPGQRANVRRIEKTGYEIFNKEALEQWNINPDVPFTIVMVKQELFKQIRDNYSKISSQSYADQYEREKAALDKERQEGRLSEERHREELENLSDWYDTQLDNLDNYVDRFARIDLAELDENERAIIELVKEGELEEAMARYDEWGLIEIIESEVTDLSEIRNAVDDLNASMSMVSYGLFSDFMNSTSLSTHFEAIALLLLHKRNLSRTEISLLTSSNISSSSSRHFKKKRRGLKCLSSSLFLKFLILSKSLFE